MKKKLLRVIFFCAVMIFATQMSVVEAEEYDDTVIDGDYSPEDGYNLDDVIRSEEEYAQPVSIIKLDSAQGFSKSLPVTHFKQENNYYCGPATTKQTIYYLNGLNLSQTDIANELKTEQQHATAMYDIPTVINKYVSGKNYSVKNIPSNQSDYAWQIYSALTIGKPVIIDIAATKSDGWKYNTNGHFLNVSGVTCNASRNVIVVTDPYSNNSQDEYTLSTVYKVNSKHWGHAYIW